jgi:hypothetical protein
MTHFNLRRTVCLPTTYVILLVCIATDQTTVMISEYRQYSAHWAKCLEKRFKVTHVCPALGSSTSKCCIARDQLLRHVSFQSTYLQYYYPCKGSNFTR